MPKKDTGGIEDIQDGPFGKLSGGINGIFNSATLRALAKKRVGDPAPTPKKANPKMSKNQIAASAKSLGYTMNKDGTFKPTPAPKPKTPKSPASGHGGY
jgi:hypothetical protein